MPKDQAQNQHDRRVRLIAAGLCYRCGKRPHREGAKSCDRCGDRYKTVNDPETNAFYRRKRKE